MEKSLEARMERVKEYLVGIWLFREPMKTPRWCATFVYRGHYYDVSGKHSAVSAVKAVEKRVKDLEAAFLKKAGVARRKPGRRSGSSRK